MENKRNHEMGKCSKCGALQFLSYNVCNYNGICDGIVEPIKSTRELAIEWWNSLNQEKQIDLQHIYRSPSRHPLNAIGLTGREIEEIWRKEREIIGNTFIGRMVDETIHPEKYNQKQLPVICVNCKEIYNNPIKTCNCGNKTFESTHPSNAKQFKEFSPDLFKAYIDKFSDEDKKEAFSIMCDILKMGEITQKDLDELEMMKFNHPG